MLLCCVLSNGKLYECYFSIIGPSGILKEKSCVFKSVDISLVNKNSLYFSIVTTCV